MGLPTKNLTLGNPIFDVIQPHFWGSGLHVWGCLTANLPLGNPIFDATQPHFWGLGPHVWGKHANIIKIFIDKTFISY
jgi:hypothetical protein